MSNLKKVLLIALSIVLIFTMTACNKKSVYTPYADWADEYIAGKILSDNKLHHFERDFRAGQPSGASFRSYCELNGILTENWEEETKFVEGKILANGDFVLVTDTCTVNYCPIAIRLRVIDDKTVETIDVVAALRGLTG